MRSTKEFLGASGRIRRVFGVLLAATLAPLSGLGQSRGDELAFDLLIQNARVVDGTGNAWFRGDVGIRDGVINLVGHGDPSQAEEVWDADDRVVSPGFIDVHTHVESRGRRGGLVATPRADNFLLDGVTTIVTGNCGGSVLDVEAWFDNLDKLGLGINVATLIGHNSIRRQVMGEVNRQARPEELEHMQSLVDEAMKQGAVGLSTGLLYVPGTYASTEEVIELARASARHGGIYASHIREQGAKLFESIDEAVRIGREASLPVQISHFKIKGKKRWGTIGRAIEHVDRYRREGIDVVIDAYPYDRASTNLGVNLPSWALSDGPDAVAKRLADRELRARILKEMRAKLDDQGFENFSFATVASYRPNPAWEGKTISEINLERGGEPTLAAELQTVLHMVEAGGASMIYHYMSDEDVETIYQYPYAGVASDGGVRVFGQGKPHPRSYGTNARVIARYVREKKTLRLEDALRRMSSLPAQMFGFRDRGVIRVGAAADLVVFDPEGVSDKATFADPHQYSEGFDLVVVNGEPMVRDGELTESRPGKTLRHVSTMSEPS